MRFVILHYHILKNAGSTVIEMLDRSFGERLFLYDTPERSGTVAPAEILSLIQTNPRIQAFSSHQIRHPLPHAHDILFFDICFLRDPLDRVRSMYDYFRKRPSPGDPVSDLANTATLGDFIAGMVTDHALHVTNVQVNLLAQAGDSDEPTRDDLNLARQRFLQTSFPGVVDLFDESAVAGEYFLRAAFPAFDCALPPVNVSKGLDSTLAARIEHLRSVCKPDVFAQLLDLNRLDFELLDCARDEITRRFCLVPDHAARLDDLRHRVASAAEGQTPPLPPPQPNPPAPAESGILIQARRVAARLGLPVSHAAPSSPEATELAPFFDAAFYLERNPDVRSTGVHPLQHYLTNGAAEGRKPHPLFDPAFYLAGCPSASRSEAAANPLLHFIRNSPRDNPSHHPASPHPLFNGSAGDLLRHISPNE